MRSLLFIRFIISICLLKWLLEAKTATVVVREPTQAWFEEARILLSVTRGGEYGEDEAIAIAIRNSLQERKVPVIITYYFSKIQKAEA